MAKSQGMDLAGLFVMFRFLSLIFAGLLSVSSLAGQKNCEGLLLLKELEPIEMLAAYENETRGRLRNFLSFSQPITTNVIYLSEEQRNSHEVFLRGGFLVDRHGLEVNYPSNAFYVLSPEGRLFIMKGQGKGMPIKLRRIFHSSLSSGKPVQMAGEIRVREGKITYIDNFSGHYRPSNDRFELFIRGLKDLGVDFSDTEISQMNRKD